MPPITRVDDQYRLRELNYTQNGKTWSPGAVSTYDTKPSLPANMEL